MDCLWGLLMIIVGLLTNKLWCIYIYNYGSGLLVAHNVYKVFHNLMIVYDNWIATIQFNVKHKLLMDC